MWVLLFVPGGDDDEGRGKQQECTTSMSYDREMSPLFDPTSSTQKPVILSSQPPFKTTKKTKAIIHVSSDFYNHTPESWDVWNATEVNGNGSHPW